MKKYLETLFWKFALYLLDRGYGYCEKLDERSFMSEGRCAACDATEVQKWIKGHIDLINYE